MMLWSKLRSAWHEMPLWIKGAAYTLALYAAMLCLGRAAGIAMTRFQIDCLKTPGRLCLPPVVQALAAAVAFGPGLFLAAEEGGTVSARVIALPAAIYSTIGAFCFHRLGPHRGFRLTVTLMLAVIVATIVGIFFPRVG